MRIMHLLKHCNNGNGNVHVAVDLACTQVATGHEVVVASSGGPYVPLLTAHGVTHVTLPHPSGTLGALHSGGALVRVTRRFRPDVLHAHMMTSALLGFAASKLLGVPLVTTMHNSFDTHSAIMRLGTVVVAVSEAERRLLLSRGYPSRRVVTVLNGAINSPRDSWEADQIGTLSRPSIMTLCGLHRRKGVDDVITAFAEVVSDYPSWHLNIVGNGPDRARLEQRVAKLGLNDAVHLLGSSRRPRSLLEQSEIYASGSLAEPFGLVVAEARAAGCAVVATAVGGVPEVLDHGRAGLLTPASDPSAMAQAFRSLMSDQEVLATWRNRAKKGSECFSVRRMSDDYLRVYAKVLAPEVDGSAERPSKF